MSETDATLDRRAFLRTMIRRGATAVGSFGLGLLIDGAWARAVRGPRLEREDYRRVVIGRWRVHHNLAGYLLLAAGVFAYPLVLVPLGLGMIVGHGRRDRLFWFIERVG
jgi:hypothetical protein